MKHSGVFIRTKVWNNIKASNKHFFSCKSSLSIKNKANKGDILVLSAAKLTNFLLLVFYFIVKEKMNGQVLYLYESNAFETYQNTFETYQPTKIWKNYTRGK